MFLIFFIMQIDPNRTFCQMRIHSCSNKSLDRDGRSLDGDLAERNRGS
jgi:hypothetical protein